MSPTFGPTYHRKGNLWVSPGRPSVPATVVTPEPETPVVAVYGAAPIGTTTYTVPTGALWVSTTGSNTNAGTQAAPYRTLAHAMTQAPANGTIVVKGGVYNEGGSYAAGNGGALAGGQFTNAGVTVQNAPGEEVWFDGSTAVTNWTADGTAWRAPIVIARDRGETHTRGQDEATWAGGQGFVNAAYPLAAWPEQVFYDGVLMTQVATRAEVVPGTFFVEGSYLGGTQTTRGATGTDKNLFTSTAYIIGSTPTGHEVRISNVSRVMTISKTDITLRGIGFRRHNAALVDFGSIYIAPWGGAARFQMYDCYIDDAANLGLNNLPNSSKFHHNTVRRNGILGVAAGHGDDIEINNCLFEKNMSARYNYGPYGGGIKFNYNHRPKVHHNKFDTNYGHACWFDQSIYDARAYSNWFVGSYGHDISYEISSKAIFADNVHINTGINSDLRSTLVSNPYWFSGSNRIQVWNATIVNSDMLFKVSQDRRRPLQSGNNYGRDPRFDDTWYSTEMTWIAEDIDVYNTVFSRSIGSSSVESVFWRILDDSQSPNAVKDFPAFGIATAGNLYNRVEANKPARFANTQSAVQGQVHVHFTMTGAAHDGTPSWKTVTGETGSVFVDGRDVMNADYTVKTAEVAAVTRTPLPADVAAAIGRPAGSTQLGAWITEEAA